MDSLICDDEGPPKRRMFIYPDPPASTGETSGWNFVVEETDSTGAAVPVWDTWEQTFAEIVRYPPLYSLKALHWKWQPAGTPISLDEAARQVATFPTTRR
jgi:hypothetical protein